MISDKEKYEQCLFPMHDRNLNGFCYRFDCRPCRITEMKEHPPGETRLIAIIDSLMKELYSDVEKSNNKPFKFTFPEIL